MIKTKIKKLSILTLSAVMSVGMMVGSFNLANVNAAEPAADEAQITVGKTLTINGTKWPNIENFGFELEAVKGYTNPNASTSVDGQSIAASAVPMNRVRSPSPSRSRQAWKQGWSARMIPTTAAAL